MVLVRIHDMFNVHGSQWLHNAQIPTYVTCYVWLYMCGCGWWGWCTRKKRKRPIDIEENKEHRPRKHLCSLVHIHSSRLSPIRILHSSQTCRRADGMPNAYMNSITQYTHPGAEDLLICVHTRMVCLLLYNLRLMWSVCKWIKKSVSYVVEYWCEDVTSIAVQSLQLYIYLSHTEWSTHGTKKKFEHRFRNDGER